MAGRKSDKQWREAILLAVNETDPKGKRRLRSLADRLVKEAMSGDIQALKEIGDRIDGKPNQDGTITFRRETVELTDDELAAIAAGRSSGDAEAAESPPVDSSIH